MSGAKQSCPEAIGEREWSTNCSRISASYLILTGPPCLRTITLYIDCQERLITHSMERETVCISPSMIFCELSAGVWSVTVLNFRFWLLPPMTLGVCTGVPISRWLSAMGFKDTTVY
jgi:hypothetical protein